MGNAGGEPVLAAKIRRPRTAGLDRPRLDAALDRLWDRKIALIVAPAGSGKTTLLSQFASTSGAPSAWYRPEPSDGTEAAFVAHLEAALVQAGVIDRATGWTRIDSVIAALEAAPSPFLLAIDDLHTLWGTDAEAAIERLIEHLPPGAAVAATSRRQPGFNLSRWRLEDVVVEVGPTDLRFRSWEVERLFRDVYEEPLPPSELAELARRTDGWAAGLQLFHLATRGKPAVERLRTLRELATRSRLVREYLATNVLDELAVHLRDFLVQTCVLGRLTPKLCDALTRSTSAAAMLSELESRQIFTAVVDDNTYTYHEVLRSHLEGVLVERLGEEEARVRYLEAGRLLEDAGFFPEALRAYARAEEWNEADRLLGGRGEQMVERFDDWIHALPSALIEHDPWLLLGVARRHVALGEWDDAGDAYSRAESAFGDTRGASIAKRERQAVAAWFAPPVAVPSEWPDLARLVVGGPPAAVVLRAEALAEPYRAVVVGTAWLCQGEADEAVAQLRAVLDHREASPRLAAGAALLLAVADLLATGDDSGFSAAVSRAEEAGLGWLAALGRHGGRSVSIGDRSAAKADVWGEPLSDLILGLAQLARGESASPDRLISAGAQLSALGAPTLAAWAAALAATVLDRRGQHNPPLRRRATTEARRLGLTPIVDLIDELAGHAPKASAADAEQGVNESANRQERSAAPPSAPDEAAQAAPLQVQLFGQTAVRVNGADVELSTVKPRVRSLLRLLAINTGSTVHRDRIVAALWPDEADLQAARRNMQTAISSLRHLLQPGVGRGEATLVCRDGDTYRIALDPRDCDLTQARAALAAARQSDAGDPRRAQLLRSALELARGPLAEEEGSAEWVVGERDLIQQQLADAAEQLARVYLTTGAGRDAVTAAEAGLRIDGYRDGLWRVLIEAHEFLGERAAAARAQRRYAEVLRELGVA